MTRLNRSRIKYTPGLCGTSGIFLFRSGFSFLGIGSQFTREATAWKSMPMAQAIYDVAIVGGGPAGSSCAGFCAASGLRTILVEREEFPREKVCGGCLNPECWPIIRRLQLEDRVRTLPHGVLDQVEFIS